MPTEMNGRARTETQLVEAPGPYFELPAESFSPSLLKTTSRPRGLSIGKDGKKHYFHITGQHKISFDKQNSFSETNFKKSSNAPNLSYLRTTSDQSCNDEELIITFNKQFGRKIPNESKSESNLPRASGFAKQELAVKSDDSSQLVPQLVNTHCGQNKTEESKPLLERGLQLTKTVESPLKIWQATWEEASRNGTLSSVFFNDKERKRSAYELNPPAGKPKKIRRIKTFHRSGWRIDPYWYHHLRIKKSNARFLIPFKRRTFKTISTQTSPRRMAIPDFRIGNGCCLQTPVAVSTKIICILLAVAILVALVGFAVFADVSKLLELLLKHLLCHTFGKCPAPVHPLLYYWNLLRSSSIF